MIVHERAEWLAGYKVQPGEGTAWWGGPSLDVKAVDNITWHYPGGDVANTANGRYVAELQAEQQSYHRRTDGGTANPPRPAPYTNGYDLGYNAMIDPDGGIWKVRWTGQRCAANGSSTANTRSFAVQLMVPTLNADVTVEQIDAARWLDGALRGWFPNIPDGVAGHTCHADWFKTACPGPTLTPRVRAGDFLWREPIDPAEEPVTDAEMNAIADKVAAKLAPSFAALYEAWFKDLWGNGVPAYNALQNVWDQVRIDKGHLVHAVTASVVAALPPGTVDITVDDVVQACKQALSEQTWTVIPGVS